MECKETRRAKPLVSELEVGSAGSGSEGPSTHIHGGDVVAGRYGCTRNRHT
jgi:hypothetical protein